MALRFTLICLGVRTPEEGRGAIELLFMSVSN